MRREQSSPRSVEGLDVERLRIAILVARFNEDITGELLAGARAFLEESGLPAGSADVYFVPGAWELPQTAARVVEAGRHDAVIALGCVIRGETPHFDFISDEAARGLGAVARSADIPVTFGVLTTDTLAQAQERADRNGQDKGREAALAALGLVEVYQRIREGAEAREGGEDHGVRDASPGGKSPAAGDA